MPGIALLLLRFTLASLVAAQGVLNVSSAGHSSSLVFLGALQILASVFLALGFYTPLNAALLGVGIGSAPLSLLPQAAWDLFCAKQTILLATVMSGVILILGPGAFSIDSYLFGRREFIIPAGGDGSRKR